MSLNRNDELSILAIFTSEYKKQYYLREISRHTKIPLKSVLTLMNRFEEKKIVKSKKVGKNKYFKLNLENIQTKWYLLQAEIKKTMIFGDKYPLFKTFLKEIKADSTIILFGSYAKSTADKDADVDLLLIGKKPVELPWHLLPYKVHKIELTDIVFVKALEKQDALIKEIEDNHIIINNHSWYIDKMWEHYGK